jgi:hypothetical protein
MTIQARFAGELRRQIGRFCLVQLTDINQLLECLDLRFDPEGLGGRAFQ